MTGAIQLVMNHLDGDSSLGLTKGTNLFAVEVARGNPSTTPANIVIVAPGGGVQPTRSMGNNEIRNTIVRVRVRNNKYSTGYALCLAILASLQAINITGTLYVEPIGGEPDYVAQTEDGLHTWTMGFTVRTLADRP